jgi:hypothetical protein
MTFDSDQVKPELTKVIGCATVMKELIPLMPPGMTYETLAAGLHASPEVLRKVLQECINNTASEVKTILIGYGLCSMAVVGLSSGTRTLVVPRADDCTAIFLGSKEEYVRQHNSVPGTLYLSRGWIEGGAPLFEPEEIIKRFGEARGNTIVKTMFKGYKRLAFIDTGDGDQQANRLRSMATAARLEITFEEIKGSRSLLIKLLYGPWDDGFVVSPPGRAISFSDFRKY